MFRVILKLAIVSLVLSIVALGGVEYRRYYVNTPRQYIKNFPESDDLTKTDEYQDTVSSWARETDTLDIANCRPNPPVIKMKDKSPLTVKNSGWRKQIFWVTRKNNFSIPARGSETVYLDLENGPGFYGFGCGNFDQNFVVRGVLVVEEAAAESPAVALPSSVISGEVAAKDGGLALEPSGFSLQGKDIALGKIYKQRAADGKYVETPLEQLRPQDQVYLSFYRNVDLIRGRIGQIEPDGSGWAISLADNPNLDERVAVTSAAKFYVEDPSGLFWKRGNKIAGLAAGDIIQISSTEVIYVAPLLGAMTGTINSVTGADGEKAIRIQGGPDDIWVGDYTLIYDQNQPQKILGGQSVIRGVGGYALYYLDNGKLRAKSLGLYDL